MKRKLISIVVALALTVLLLPSAVLADGAPLGIQGNGTGNLYIDINAAPYTTFAQKDWGQYAYKAGGCAWFASSRVNQLTGKGDTIWSGESWYNGRGAELGFTTGSTIQAKCLACYGHHVSVIEAVEGNNVLVSEGGYTDSDHGYCIIHWKSLEQVLNGDNGSLGEFLGFVYLGVSGNNSGGSSGGTNTTFTTGLYEITTISDALNVRSGAGDGYEVIGQINKGSIVNVTATNGSWGRINYNGRAGWIALQFCTPTTSSNNPVTKITLSTDSVYVNIGGSTRLSVSFTPSGSYSSVSWKSSNPNVATIDSNGTIRGVSAGYSVITASAGGRTDSCLVSVTFNDVRDSGTYFYRPVYWAVGRTITVGTGNNLFSPNVSCTRAQVVTFLWKTLASPSPSSNANPFYDVAPGTYYYDAIRWAAEQGITSGTSANQFSPDKPCTRAEVLTFLWHAYGSPKESSSNQFVDVPADSYYAIPVTWAYKNKITTGVSSTVFAPDEYCSRCQMVTFLYHLYS